MKITINALQEMEELAQKLAINAEPNDVILLKGDLGAGKTTFSQFFGKALGVERNINSPTFNIIKSYQGRLPFHHMDCYRLEEDGEDLGFDDYFYGEGVTLIEWPQMIEDFLPDTYLVIDISYVSPTSREVTLEANGIRYERVLEELV
ncbi:tRNA (adenosine(37)-N6)-threonylcarbamoyltransferase complex ATPase subunit type 1 TsaE [Macrococcus hajekii]|uniref:tRNA threonylcarbamoyladenosine biosynthesis protein TsaE n=1 Tax=Macrococcus hajekii TaxID=198482 RepID=A0A4R6BIJ6_9STAP|nr:tRNA (adenosine(37)-N6)-threonylcarbamoyltransferase complex ATPase subunit type 1 TsaE [Macrococcus hajekii]TDM01390.1 tRNA (adenosine(37)-N6)-threonylcarbamoyltransferase complex ATPase subunit type 1 TsaE [Macrococcus hajekii]GGB11214.1 tRNA (adenosine(37)-N6)-threonylcarbamoyltransferase complex ATPase subunit type 1 TsaE [Macrococcus hajekii]